MQGRKEDSRQRCDERAEADDNAIDPSTKTQLELAQIRLYRGDVGFSGDVFVNRVKNLRGNPLRGFAIDIRVR